MNIQDGDKFLFEPISRQSAISIPHEYVVYGVKNNYFGLKEGSRSLGARYTMQDVERWFKSTTWKVTYFPVVTKSVSEILDECQDI